MFSYKVWTETCRYRTMSKFIHTLLIPNEAHFHLNGLTSNIVDYGGTENQQVIHQRQLHHTKPRIWCVITTNEVAGPCRSSCNNYLCKISEYTWNLRAVAENYSIVVSAGCGDCPYTRATINLLRELSVQESFLTIVSLIGCLVCLTWQLLIPFYGGNNT